MLRKRQKLFIHVGHLIAYVMSMCLSVHFKISKNSNNEVDFNHNLFCFQMR